MLFNSFEYLIFFPVVAILYFVTPQRLRWSLLLVASCVFYMSLIPYYILFVAVIILNDYSAARLIEKNHEHKRIFLCQSLIVNLGLLFVFKYYDFFVENLTGLFSSSGLSTHLPLIRVILPIGLSFYTFKSIGYVIEVYRAEIKAERHVGIYALYVLFFPEILAGPIDRGNNLLPQFFEKHDFDYQRITGGLKLIAWGVFKKVVIADRIAIVVSQVYGNLNEYSGVPLIITAVLYSFQIYFDFSGYTDIAIGSGKILGFNLPENFNVPYISQSITEFWRRWHISLSTWVRDYLYTPLAIATRGWGMISVLFSLFVTFVLLGLWHGAGWTFVIFGVLHGGALIYEALTKKFRKKLSKSLPSAIYNRACNLLAFSYVTFAFIFFRSDNISQAWLYISKMSVNVNLRFGGYRLGIGQFEFLVVIVLIAFAMSAEIYSAKKDGIIKMISSKPAFVRWGFYYTVILLIIIFGEFGENNFIYFKF